MKKLLSLILLAAIASASVASAALTREEEDKLIAALKAGSDLKPRVDACRELGRSGSAASVPALAALLADPQMSHMARFALETIPGPEATAALRDALAGTKEDLLVGVINSLGVRKDAKAVPALAGLVSGGDAKLAFAAAAALGEIATPEAGAELLKLLAAKPDGAADGVLRYADAMVRAKKGAEAARAFDALKQASVSEPVRQAAIRGAIVARGADGLALFKDALKSADRAQHLMALSALRDCPGAAFTKATLDVLAEAPAERRAAMLDALGARGDRSAVAEMLKLARAGAPDQRAAALKALARIGDISAFGTLLECASDADEAVAQAALAGIAAFAGREADGAVLKLLGSGATAQRKLGIELIYQRRITAALPQLLRLAYDQDGAIRLASIEAIGRMAGEEEIGALLGILQRAGDEAERKAAEKAINATCNRLATPSANKIVIQKAEYGDLPDGKTADVTAKVRGLVKMGTVEIEASNGNFGDPADGKVKKFHVEYVVDGQKRQATVAEGQTVTLAATVLPDAVARKIAEAFGPSQGEARAAMLRIMSRNADERSLAALREALKSGEAAAARALCNWASPAALPDVLALMKSGGDDTLRALAFRGAIRLAPLQDAPPARRAATLADLLAAAGNEADRKLVLAALVEVPCAETFKLAADRIADPALRIEAALAAVSVAEQLKGAALKEARPVLQAIAKDAASDTGKRAAALLK